VWILLSLTSGIFDGVARGVIKKTEASFLVVAFSGVFFALPFYVAMLFVEGLPVVKDIFWLIVVVHAVLLTIANAAMVRAHQLAPLILTVPFLSLTNVFLLITSPIMKGGVPNVYGLIGAVAIAFGLYLTSISAKETGVLGPFRAFAKNRGSQLMLLVALIYSVTANLDNLAIKNSSVFFYLVWDSIFVASFLAALAFYFLWRNKIVGEVGNMRTAMLLLLCGVTTAVSVIPQAYAYSLAIVPYVISLKRSGVMLATFAGMVYFKEKDSFLIRIIGFIMAFGGAALITVYGIS